MVQFHTFDQYTSVLSAEAPHALVQEWWTRLEREIRAVSKTLGYKYKNSAVGLIDALGSHASVEVEVIAEIHALRRTRNAVVHDLDAPSITAKNAEEYARRAWALSWLLSELH